MKTKTETNHIVPSLRVSCVSLNLKAWIGVLALPVHRYVVYAISLFIFKLGRTAPVFRVISTIE